MCALAAVAAATGAMAQSTVGISGLLEIAPVNNTKITQDNGSGTAEFSRKNSGTANTTTWATSVITFSGTEDLGGGLRASFVVMSGIGAGATDTGMGNRERTLALAGNFGTVRWGRFVPTAAVGYHGFSGAGSSTLAGSIYTLAAAANAPAAPGDGVPSNFIHGTNSALLSVERQDNVIQYTSPTMNGFTVNVNYGRNGQDWSDEEGKTRRAQDGIHVGYVNGPFSAGFGMNNMKLNSETTGSGNFPALPANSSGKADLDWIGASYDFGVARLFGTHAKRKDTLSRPGQATATINDIKINAVGVSVPVGAVTLRASTYRGKNKGDTGAGDDEKLSGYQLSAVYALSKRTSIVAAMGQNQMKRDGGNTLGANAKIKASTLTMTHAF